MAGLLGDIFSAGNVAKRKLTDLLGNPILSTQQMLGNLNDRARVLNEMTAAAAREGVSYGPSSQQLAGLLSEAYNPIGLTVFHGSPAKFQKFDPTKIGSGEGAQAYGYGHYVAESPDVAKSYAFGLNNKKAAEQLKKLSNSNNIVDKAAAARLFYDDAETLSQFIKSKSPNISNSEIDKIIQESKTKFNDVKQNYGNIYEVDLPDDQIARMLDFDKPLMQQSKEIQALAKQYGLTDADHMGGDLIAAMDAKRPAGAELMRQAGVPGIRYLDQGSRGTKQGTSNFVVFPGNEDLLRILERNNQPLSLLD